MSVPKQRWVISLETNSPTIINKQGNDLISV